MTSTTTMNVRIGFLTRRGNALSISGYRSIRTGFANGKPTFADERVQLVAFDQVADTLSVVKGARASFEVAKCYRRSDGSEYIKIVSQVVKAAEPVQAEAPAEAQPVQAEDIEQVELERLLELVAETEAPNASFIRGLASLNAPAARELALKHLRPLHQASFTANAN